MHPVTLQQKRTLSAFLSIGQKQKPRRASGEMLLAEAGRESHRKKSIVWAFLGLAPRAQIRLPLWGWPGLLAPSIIPRSTHQETLKHTKPHYWETCRQIINFLGTIKAFSYSWLQMLVTCTCTRTLFFSPASLFQKTSFPLAGNSREK